MKEIKKYSWLIIFPIAFFAIVGWWEYQIYKIDTESKDFISNLENLKNAFASVVPLVDFQSMQYVGDGWYFINSNEANPDQNSYYAGDPIEKVSSSEFASSTRLASLQIKMLINLLNKYPYIDEFNSDPNLQGECNGVGNSNYRCDSIEFYLKKSKLDPTYDKEGYLYIPFTFAPTSRYQTYLNQNFGTVQEIAPNWYTFIDQQMWMGED